MRPHQQPASGWPPACPPASPAAPVSTALPLVPAYLGPVRCVNDQGTQSYLTKIGTAADCLAVVVQHEN